MSTPEDFLTEVHKWFVSDGDRPYISAWRIIITTETNTSNQIGTYNYPEDDFMKVLLDNGNSNNEYIPPINENNMLRFNIPESPGFILPDYGNVDNFTSRDMIGISLEVKLSTTADTVYEFPVSDLSNHNIDGNDFVHGDYIINFSGDYVKINTFVEAISASNTVNHKFFIPFGCSIKKTGAWTISTRADQNTLNDTAYHLTVDDTWAFNEGTIKFSGVTQQSPLYDGKPDWFEIYNENDDVLETVVNTFGNINNWSSGDKIIFTYTNPNTIYVEEQ